MEKRRPGFFEFMVEQTGPWIMWFIIIWTMISLGMIAGTLSSWCGMSPAFNCSIHVTAGMAYWFWIKLQVGVKPDRFTTY
jgi:hypothetical protein